MGNNIDDDDNIEVSDESQNVAEQIRAQAESGDIENSEGEDVSEGSEGFDDGGEEASGEEAGQGSGEKGKTAEKAEEKAKEEFKNSKAGQKLDEEKAKAKEKFDNSAVGKKVNDVKDKVGDKIKEKTGLDKIPNIPTSPKKAKEKAKKELKKKVKQKAKQELAKKGVTKAVIMPILGAVGGFLLFLIVIVGVVMFFVAMPGQVMSALKNFGKSLLTAINSAVEGQENQVKTEEIAEVANYLESMGYDLKGEGFITSSSKTKYTNGGTADIGDNTYTVTYDDDQDVWRDTETDEVVDLNSDCILAYIVSDNLCYIIKNFNQNLEAASDTTSFGLFAGVALVLTVVAGCLLGPLALLFAAGVAVFTFMNASNPNWGTGLISIWHEGSSIGTTNGSYKTSETGYIELDADSATLKIKRGWTNNAYSYDVSGWSGRYGMPLEFLLSVHVATQMPDLAMEMATTFDTDVQVILRKVSGGQVEGGYQVGNGTSDADILSWSEIETVFQQNNSWLTKLVDSYTIQGYELAQLFEAGLPHDPENCTCCSHVPNSLLSSLDEDDLEEDCDEVSTDYEEGNWKISDEYLEKKHHVCDACRKYVKTLVKALKKINDNDWNSYTPYISQVTNHWFRDVYFVIQDTSSVELTEVDEDYFYETEERWSIYETYKEGDAIPEGFEVGDYKYYEYDADGTEAEGYENGYKLSTRTKEEVDALEEALANGEDVVRLVKKPTTTFMNDGDGSVWSAYEDAEESTDVGWTQLTVSDDDDVSDAIATFAGKLYYTETRPNDITQVEDGQRGVTNDTIKTMFVNNYYYQYDGTTTRADAIEEDRQKMYELYGTTYTVTGDEENYDSTSLSDEYYNKINTDDDPRDSSLISKVSIAKDSLNAFSILENTHTVDADYIYRDFKELIVELNYFDKEDLSDKVQTVMQWILPDTGSGGWPIRQYEKGETFYGTLINSKADLDLLKSASVSVAEAALGALDAEVDEETMNSTELEIEDTSSDDDDDDEEEEATASTVAATVSSLVQTGYDVHAQMETGSWDYCVYNEDSSHWYSGNHHHGLLNTIQEAVASTNYHNACCATFVSWVLQEAGLKDGVTHSAKGMYDWAVEQGWTAITDKDDLEAGDIIFNKSGYSGTDTSNIGHVQMLGNDGEWLNAGSVSAINSEPKAYDLSYFIIGMRPTGLAGSVQPFEGYEPDTDVVSPVTGRIVDYGEVTRTNEETGEDETVEYIKIEAINSYVYDTENSGSTYSNLCQDEETTFDATVTDETQKNLEGYDYFYDEYQGVIDGFVVYIEGFDLTLYDADGAWALIQGGDTISTDVTRYAPSNTVYNMVDNIKEAQYNWKEDAKSAAIPMIEINGELYIKEGTVIGKTYEDIDDNIVKQTSIDEETGEEIVSYATNGNYIRLIMRDLEDAIIEDIEEYMDLDDGVKSGIDSNFPEEFIFFLGVLSEGCCEGEHDLGSSYGVVVLNDGAGNTTAFGLTKAVASTGDVPNMYPDFATHLANGSVPKQEAQDVFVLVLEAARESIIGEDQSGGMVANPSVLDENVLDALVDLHHASPTQCAEVCDEINSGNTDWTTLFTEHWGTNTNYEAALKQRAENRGVLASEGRYLSYNNSNKEVIFNSETPWTDFCNGSPSSNLYSWGT